MTPAPELDAERDLHEAAAELVRRRLREGARRIVVWGPPGIGRTWLIGRLARLEAAVTFVDAPTLEHARAALSEASRPIVVACVERDDLDADAFVELAPLSLDASEAFLTASLRRDGVEVDEVSRRALAGHADGSPAALVRAAALCRVLAPAVWVERCEEACTALVTFGRSIEHPLLGAARPLAWDDATRRVAVLLLAAGEPVSPKQLEAWSPGSLDALIALRDRALLAGGDTITLRHAAARSLALDVS